MLVIEEVCHVRQDIQDSGSNLRLNEILEEIKPIQRLL
jgi:hypothetical protein